MAGVLVRRELAALLLMMVVSAACAPVTTQPVSPSTPARALEWRPANTGLPAARPVFAFAADPNDPRVLLVATATPPQLYRSADGGASWQPVGQALRNRLTYALLADPSHRSVFLAGTSDGLFRSIDSGLIWEPVPDVPRPVLAPRGLERYGRSVYALLATADGMLYLAGEDARPWRSQDGGASWEPLSPLPTDAALLALAAAGDGRLLVGTGGAGLFASADDGRSWQRLADIPETFVAGLWLDPLEGRSAYARTRVGFYRSADGGRNWQAVRNGFEGRVDALWPGPTAGQALLLTNAGQLYATADGGQTWQPRGALDRPGTAYGLWPLADVEGPALVAATHAGLWQGDGTGSRWQPWADGPGQPVVNDLILAADGALYVATTTGVYRSDDHGATWMALNEGLPGVAILSVAAAPSAAGVLYAGTDGRGLYRSADHGRTWAATALEVPSVPAILIHPADPSHLFVRAAFQRVYESRDGGHSWRTPWNGLDLSTELISLGWGPGKPLVLYAGGTEQLYRSTDAGGRWQSIAAELTGQTVFHVLPDPTEPDRLYAGATHGVYVSRDGGASWTQWGRGLEDVTIVALALHPARPVEVFAGSRYRGGYRTLDGGATWQPAGLDGLSVHRLVISADGRQLIAATDQGLWRAALAGGMP